MKKMKKILALVLCLVLAVGAVTGTLAYLTDRDSEVNVFTVGDVSIELNEEFEQGSKLTPGVKINKDVTITNTGKNDAWVWYTYAVPSALVDNGDKENAKPSLNTIHFNLEAAYWDSYYNQEKYYTAAGLTEPVAYEDTWNWYGIEHDVDILGDGSKYTVVTCLYNGKLLSGETTNVGLTQVYLDTRIDITPEGDWYWVENGDVTKLNWNTNTNGAPSIYVSAYAIQDEGFTDVQAAYAAYGTQWGENGTEYGNVVVATPTPGAVRPAGYAPATEGETIDGMTILDQSDDETNLRALYKDGMTGNLTVDNSTLDGTYAMNVTAKEEADAKLSATNTTFMGWVSYSGWDSATFTDCTFRINSEGTYNYIRAYDPTTFVNCEFKDTTFDIVVANGGSIVLENCTYNGETIDSTDDLKFDTGRTEEELSAIKEAIEVANNG